MKNTYSAVKGAVRPLGAYGMCHHGLCSEPVTLRISLNTEKEQDME